MLAIFPMWIFTGALIFRLEAGELVAVIGPNGAGKSTLAKTIAGLLTPRLGTITLAGEDITYLRPNQIVKKGIGYVPQIANVFRTLTIEENLEMGAFTKSGNLKALKERVYDTFPRLAERRQQRAGTLSGGGTANAGHGTRHDARSANYGLG